MKHLSMLELNLSGMSCQLVRLYEERLANRLADYYQHSHPTMELQVVTKGSCTIFGNGSYYDLRSGQLILLPPGFYHQTKSHSPDCIRITMAFSLPSRKTADKAALPTLTALKRRLPTVLDLSDSLDALLAQVQQLLQQSASYNHTEQLRCLSCLFLLTLAERLTAAGEDPSPSSETDAPSPTAYAIDEFLGRNFHSNQGCQQLADLLHVSPRQLTRIIRDAYGMNYREKLKEIRLAIAMDFLTTSDMSIAEIAELLGYSSPANFSTFVKSVTGRTPSQLRKEGRSLQVRSM